MTSSLPRGPAPGPGAEAAGGTTRGKTRQQAAGVRESAAMRGPRAHDGASWATTASSTRSSRCRWHSSSSSATCRCSGSSSRSRTTTSSRGSSGPPGSGWAIFDEVFRMVDFWDALRNTLVLNGLDLVVGFPAPIILALLLNEVRGLRAQADLPEHPLPAPLHLVGHRRDDGARSSLPTNSGLVNIAHAQPRRQVRCPFSQTR